MNDRAALTLRSDITITERGERDSCLGRVRQLKIFVEGYPPLFWSEVWEAFRKAYPDCWAVQVFPPEEELVDVKSVYHLWVLEGEPWGLNLRSEGRQEQLRLQPMP